MLKKPVDHWSAYLGMQPVEKARRLEHTTTLLNWLAILLFHERGDIPAAFAAIEKILNEGKQEARDLAGIGVSSRRSDQIILAGQVSLSHGSVLCRVKRGGRLKKCGKAKRV